MNERRMLVFSCLSRGVSVRLHQKRTKQAHNLKITSYQRRCDVLTSHRRRYDVVLTSCARSESSGVNFHVYYSAEMNTYGQHAEKANASAP